MAEFVTLERPSEGVAVVTMANPATFNQCTWAAIGELAEALAEARTGGARISVLASGVEGQWLQHAWLVDLIATAEDESTTGDGRDWFRVLDELTATSVVSIAAITGDTAGGGCEIGWACDLRIAEEHVRFTQPEVRLGIGTGLGGTSRLRHLVGRTVAAEMVLEGAPIGAARLERLGAVNRVVATGTGLAAALEWAERLAAHPPDGLAGIKQMLTAGDELARIPDGVMSDQQIFWTFSATAGALATMRQYQDRYDAGEAPRQVWGDPTP